MQNNKGQASLLSPVAGSKLKYWILKGHISNVCTHCVTTNEMKRLKEVGWVSGKLNVNSNHSCYLYFLP